MICRFPFSASETSARDVLEEFRGMVVLERYLEDLDQWSPRWGARDNPPEYRKKIVFVQLRNIFLKCKTVFISSLPFFDLYFCVCFIKYVIE